MKISKLFHWLYASVMMLPLFASICFAIYTRNENSTFTQNVDYQINKVVNYNQIRPNFISYSTNISGVDVESDTTGIIYLSGSALSTGGRNGYRGFFENTGVTSLLSSHKYYLKFNLSDFTQYFLSFHICNLDDSTSLYSFTTSSIFNSLDNNTIYFGLNFTSTTYNYDDLYFTFDLFDLTLMFGSGNEPTIEEFNAWYPNDYYVYNSGEIKLLKNYSSVIYSNTDVGSQLIYTLYNSTNNYFNVTNFLGLNNLYDWISINIFNGTPALAFSLFYMLLSYWLLVSIFWLVFDVVMYVPNLAHRWLDKGSLQ